MTLRVIIEHSFRKASLSIAFDARTPGVIALFGPSGAGKTSVMLTIAGLLKADRARVVLDNEPLHTVPAEQRGIGYVFQDGRLFPHMSVATNLRYGLRRVGKGPIKFDHVVSLLSLGKLLGRKPHTLSGGERQRVAIGRALLSQPRMLVMDEPLSALDQAKRDEILPYLAHLRRDLRLPILYSTHSLDEVTRLADSLVLLEEGRVRACGPVGEVLSAVDQPLAERRDATGVLHGVVASHIEERGLSTIACGAELLSVPMVKADLGARVRLLVPAREVVLALEPPRATSVSNAVSAVVIGVAEKRASHAALVSLDMAGGQLLARVTIDSAERLGLVPGREVLALIKAMSVELVEE
jgi:molybdate transport system ATP-binding protein